MVVKEYMCVFECLCLQKMVASGRTSVQVSLCSRGMGIEFPVQRDKHTAPQQTGGQQRGFKEGSL